MRVPELIQRKREGEELEQEELAFLIEGYMRGEIPDYQISAFLMAVFFKGLTEAETDNLTALMIASGEKLDLSDIPGLKVDKHSTGGVGDKTSLIAALIAAAAG
ncbi:MAG: thymidine phosphorylase, partial [Acidobacteria bacterium]|nr:thymidine phosphorylase [Acidobacteriota bacterium]